MGRTQGAYRVEFPEGSMVRIASKAVLKEFVRPAWKYHHPLESSQVDFAGQTAKVVSASFDHGGDELYELENVPGIWHEACLESRDGAAA